MRPDPDMMAQAISKSNDALGALGRFHGRVALQFGRDASHASAFQNIRDLADELQSIGAKLHHVTLDADERLTPAARIQK